MEVHVLEVAYHFGGREEALYPVMVKSGSECLLVDCGYAGFTPLLQKSAAAHGLSLEDLTGIIITHHDIDHMGALYELKQQYPLLHVYASAVEEPYISGKQKSLRLQQAEDLQACLPEAQRAGALQFQELLKTVRPVPVDATFPLGEEPFLFKGIQIIATPGHMPGHISLYVEASQTLIAADAVVYQDGKLEIANPEFTLDLPAALASVKKLRALPINTLICYHGGVVQGAIPSLLNGLLERNTGR